MTIMMPAPDQAVLARRDASVKALRAMGGNSEVRRIAADADPLRLKITPGNILHGRLIT